MRTGIIGNICGNFLAMKAAVDYLIPRVDRIISCGNLIGYIPMGSECIKLKNDFDIQCIRGEIEHAISRGNPILAGSLHINLLRESISRIDEKFLAQFINSCVPYEEIESTVVVRLGGLGHSNPNPNMGNDEFQDIVNEFDGLNIIVSGLSNSLPSVFSVEADAILVDRLSYGATTRIYANAIFSIGSTGVPYNPFACDVAVLDSHDLLEVNLAEYDNNAIIDALNETGSDGAWYVSRHFVSK